MGKRVKSKAQGPHVDFELHTLGWKSFQDLCATVMSEVLGQTFRVLSDSHDLGQDGVFYGTWKRQQSEVYEGTFTTQCKFTSDPTKSLTLADLSNEITKVRNLSSQGQARNYFILTNAKLTGKNDKAIRETFQGISGVERCAVFERKTLTRFIRDNARLRRLVPRVYGLGDVSGIFDGRACDQAREILSSLGDNLRKFVITEPFEKSSKALIKHGFVLLLGEPACGKSTIAEALALGALDVEGCPTFRITDGNDFKTHWDPHDPKQFFWVDDAFGQTQYDQSSVDIWNRVFPYMAAAIKRGARVLFTSRDYIYKAARRDLKEAAFPVITESQVVINVEEISKEAREKILYNHIKLGTQPRKNKTRLKPFLPRIASHKRFTPEIARRLGDPMFTEGLEISEKGCDDFVSHPKGFLRDVLKGLDLDNLSAIALVFMRGGTLPCRPELSDEEKRAVERLGGSRRKISKALTALSGSLLTKSIIEGNDFWRFKHPTIREGFSALIGGNAELLDVYLAGTPTEAILAEVSCAGVVSRDEEVVLPVDRYDRLIERIGALDIKKGDNKRFLHAFLTYRADGQFLERYVERNPDFIANLSIGPILDSVSDVSDVKVMARLYEFGLLPESKRISLIQDIKALAVETPDSGFVSGAVRRIITDDEFSDILYFVRENLLPNLSDVVSDWSSNYSLNSDWDPDAFFDTLKDDLTVYRDVFEEDEDSISQIDNALSEIESEIEYLREKVFDQSDWDDGDYSHTSGKTTSGVIRSIFDDVDE